jgi:hypothetical protein
MTNAFCCLLLWEASFSTKNFVLNFHFKNPLTIHEKKTVNWFLNEP